MYDYTDLVGYIIKSIVAKPDEVKVTMVEGERTNRVEVSLANEDVGKVIGRNGRTINALRTVVRASSVRLGRRVLVDVVD